MFGLDTVLGSAGGGFSDILGAWNAHSLGNRAESGQAKANNMNNFVAGTNIAFQERMARHAHRYEVQDLRKAGLNPILSGTGGAGASTPSGASSRNESVEGAGVSSALEALTAITNALLTREQTDKTRAETENTQARTNTERTQPGYVRAGTKLLGEQATTAKATQANIDADTRLKEIGQKVSMTEIDKNNALTTLFQKQGLTQDMQSRLLSVNADQGVEILKGLKNTGAINESQFGQTLQLIDRFLDTVNKIPVLGSKR